MREFSVITREIDDILTLLALSIFADKRVFAAEIDAFMGEAKKLQNILNFDPKLTEAGLLSWFECHREDLRRQIESPEFSTWIVPLLKRLEPLRYKTRILDIMYEISISDGELHQSESGLIYFTAKHWNVNYTPPVHST